MKVFWTIAAVVNACAVLAAGIAAPQWDWQSHLNLLFTFGCAYVAGATE